MPMTIPELMKRFSTFGGKMPRQELKEAVRQQEAITPLLLQNLDDVFEKAQTGLDNINWDDPDFELFMYSCFLLSKFREQRAFPKLMRFYTLDFEIMDLIFMESAVSELPSFLYCTFNGDLEDAKKYAGDTGVNSFARIPLIHLMAALAQDGRMDRDEFRDCLRQWIRNVDPDTEKDFVVPGELVSAVSWLQFQDLVPDALRLFDEELMEPIYATRAQFLASMDGKGRIDNQNPAHQITNISRELSRWSCFH